MRLQPGHHVMALTTVSAANFGGEGASAACDQPVAVDSWTQLPYLPDSALKGVIAGRWGNLHKNGELNMRRAQRFGSPDKRTDDDFRQGTPSPVVFGDGYLVCFPVQSSGGAPVRVFPASTLARLSSLRSAPAGSVSELPNEWSVVGNADPDHMPTPLRFEPLEILSDYLKCLLGKGEDLGEFLIAAPQAASALWRLAVEERTLTALVGMRKTVEEGSLRRVQMIPEGCVFASQVTVVPGEEINLGSLRHIQLGAWEGIGAGFLRVEIVEESLSSSSARERGTSGTATIPRREDEIMRHAYAKIKKAAESAFASKLRTIVFELAPRLKSQGLSRTLAFCLAKARPLSEDPDSIEREAYLWAVKQMVPGGERLPGHNLVAAARELIEAPKPEPPQLASEWLWFRRFGEALLKREERA